MEKVFEVVDTSNDEMYYPMGIFLSLEDAKKEVLEGAEDHESPMTEYGSEGDYEQIEVRERKVGWSPYIERTVFKIVRENRYQENSDEHHWVTTFNSDEQTA